MEPFGAPLALDTAPTVAARAPSCRMRSRAASRIAPRECSCGRPRGIPAILDHMVYNFSTRESSLPSSPAAAVASQRTEEAMSTNIDVVLQTIDAVEQRDPQALFALYHPDVELCDAPSL